MSRFTKISILFLTFFTSMFVGKILNEKLMNSGFFVPKPFIISLNSTSYRTDRMMGYLEEFNRRGNNDLYSLKWGYRPIFVYETSLSNLDTQDTSILGKASYNSFYCVIEVSNALPEYELRLVLLHELLHCFDFPHVSEESRNMGDLMDESLSIIPEETNIDHYANELYKKTHP